MLVGLVNGRFPDERTPEDRAPPCLITLAVMIVTRYDASA